MIKTQVTAVIVLFSLVFARITSGRYFQDTDDRDKRQIGDLRTAEYLALITLNKSRLPSHCAAVACGLVDVIARLEKRTMSDQRLAELQALIALSRGNGIPIGHGQIDPELIGKRRKRSADTMFRHLNEGQKYKLLDIIMSRAPHRLS